MASAVIVDVVRTAGGKRNGSLSGWHPVDLAAHVLQALVERNDLDPALIDDVIVGCVSQIGNQAANVGRNAVLAAGWPDSVPGTSVDRQCGSSQQALHFAGQGVAAGAYDLVVAGGVEVMTTTPLGSSYHAPLPGGFPFGPAMRQRYEEVGGLVPQGIAAELIAERWGLTRDELDRYSAESHARAARATADGRFAGEIVPTQAWRWDVDKGGPVEAAGMVTADEGIRPDTSVEVLATLKPSFRPGGMITAGNSSQITDGASAALVASEEAAARLGLPVRARLHSYALAGDDPILMLTAPIRATTKVLARAGLTLDEIDLVEINEAFAPVILAWAREHHADVARVNVNGGAIALGHPVGASGTKLLATLVNELERTGGRYGLLTMCEGGGLANATVIERV
ncbi:MAG TPA: acetyl-CoA C-acyltransferase [Acidimicrobiales bacterium]